MDKKIFNYKKDQELFKFTMDKHWETINNKSSLVNTVLDKIQNTQKKINLV